VTAPKLGEHRGEEISGACRIHECGYCHGNVDLQVGDGPAVALFRCACTCHRDRIRVERQA
jgi:hypothetical protein